MAVSPDRLIRCCATMSLTDAPDARPRSRRTSAVTAGGETFVRINSTCAAGDPVAFAT